MRRLIFFSSYVLLLGAAASCTKVPSADENDISNQIEKRIGKKVFKKCENELIGQLDLLKKQLTVDAAIQIALLNNPNVKAIFEEIGVAHADLIEAGLFSNPTFELEVRYPPSKGFVTNIEYLITSTLLDIFLIPMRKKMAEVEFEQVKLKVVSALLDTAYEVKALYGEMLYEQQKLLCTQSIAELVEIQKDIAQKQFQAGNINDLDYQIIDSEWREVLLELATGESTIVRLEEKLKRKLGFSEDEKLVLVEPLPEALDQGDYPLSRLQQKALEQRLELGSARFEILRLCRQMGLKEAWTYSLLQAGIAGEREPDGPNFLGFGLSGEVPLFNYGQAARMKICAQLRQAWHRLSALEIEILSEVREAYQQTAINASVVYEYQTKIVPLQNEILASSEKMYHVMGLGVDKLIEAKRKQYDRRRCYLDALKAFWISRIELDRSVGGDLTRIFGDCQ